MGRVVLDNSLLEAGYFNFKNSPYRLSKAQIEKFIGSCWDTGLEIGSSVRTVTECVQEASADITVQTSLLEARFLVGSVKLFKTFQKHYAIALDPKAFFLAKTLEMRQRHTKYENTPYSLEPN
jgi:[protein-PII] uridylyltransferase